MKFSNFLYAAFVFLPLHAPVQASHHLVARGPHPPPSPTSPASSAPAPASGAPSASPKSAAAAAGSSLPVFGAGPISSSTPTPSSSSKSPAPSHKALPSVSLSGAVSGLPTITTGTSLPTKTANATIPYVNPLPVQPTITPAYGISGLVLLVTGIAYLLIGIRSRWMYILVSVLYLTSLSITVLIVYVAQPPISNGVQAAYFVAAFLPGVILGVAALVFKDVTESLACIFGGFSLAMWFLTLKAGGLTSILGAKCAIIGGLSALPFCLFFVPVLRTYILIGSIAFGGATAIILGIDCFSRAGLKEFWIYIWNLNDKLFPLNTTTYPLTRAMKVEVACTVILFACGVLSQMKLWKILKERKDRKAALRAQDEEDRERLDTHFGQQVEETTNRERAQWEAHFAEKNGTRISESESAFNLSERGVGSRASSVKGAPQIVIQEFEGDGLEMANLASSSGTNIAIGNKTKADASTTELPALESEPFETSWRNSYMSIINGASFATDQRSSTLSVERETKPSPNLQKLSLKPSAPPPPVVVPLPFRVPSPVSFENAKAPHYDDARSINPDADQLSVRDISRPSSPDGLPQDNLTRRPRSNSISNIHRRGGSNGSATEASETKRRHSEPSLPDSALGKDVKPISRPPSTGITPTAKMLGLSTLPENKRYSASTMADADAESRLDLPSRPVSGAVPANANAASAAPERLSKVALHYRTNEWAKHLEAAEAPILEELEPSEGVLVEHRNPTEAGIVSPVVDIPAAPASVKSEAVPEMVRRASEHSVASAMPSALQTRPSVPIYSQGVSRQSSSSTVNQLPSPASPNQGVQESSALRDQPLVESPKEQEDSVSPLPSSMAPLRSIPQQAKSRLASSRAYTEQSSKRQSTASQQSRPNSAGSRASQAYQPAIYDSHQPRRGPSVDSMTRQSRMASFRDSLRHDASGRQTPVSWEANVESQRRSQMMNDMQHARILQQQQEAAKAKRISEANQKWRTGEMLESHRAALRKMQNEAAISIGSSRAASPH